MNPCYKRFLSLILALTLFVFVLTGCYDPTMSTPGSSSVLLSGTTTVPGTSTAVTEPPTTATQPPVTEPPVTEPPVTEPPVTEPPVTEPPVTEPPVTEPPVTEPPVTEPPVTEPPVTEPPVTEPPVTEPPVTEPPVTEPPVTEPPVTQPPTPGDIPAISAKYAFVYDTRSQQFLYASADPGTSVYPASITKLFTTYVALQYLQVDQIVTVGRELSYVASDASIAGFRKGDKVSVQNLVYGALLPSGCDASYILAAAAGRVILADENAVVKDAVSAFMQECNRQAAALGMENTNFSKPDGYHASNHYISLQAMVIIGTLALENATIAKACGTASVTITYQNANGNQCTATFQNTNKTIDPGSTAYHALSVGLKTGTTAMAGACLLAAYRVDGGYLLVGVFGCKDNLVRFTDANALFDAFRPKT